MIFGSSRDHLAHLGDRLLDAVVVLGQGLGASFIAAKSGSLSFGSGSTALRVDVDHVAHVAERRQALQRLGVEAAPLGCLAARRPSASASSRRRRSSARRLKAL